jgi:hypothetical protein
VVVDTSPRDADPALGMCSVCVVPVEVIVTSVPLSPVVKSCVVPVRPLREVIPDPALSALQEEPLYT